MLNNGAAAMLVATAATLMRPKDQAEIGPPRQIFEDPQHERTKRFLSQILH